MTKKELEEIHKRPWEFGGLLLTEVIRLRADIKKFAELVQEYSSDPGLLVEANRKLKELSE